MISRSRQDRDRRPGTGRSKISRRHKPAGKTCTKQEAMTTDLSIRIDTDLLRSQRSTLIELCDSGNLTPEETEHLDGLINMADSLLDKAEGFDNEETTRFAPVSMKGEKQ